MPRLLKRPPRPVSSDRPGGVVPLTKSGMETGELQRHRLGSILVALQFGLIIVLGLLAAPVFLGWEASVGAWLLALAGVSLGLWALSANRPGNFNIRPTPRIDGRLVNDGPYRWIRHPMYTSVAACAGACAWAAASPWGWLAALALAAVLFTKASFEERWLALSHPDYETYRTRTRRFLPGLF